MSEWLHCNLKYKAVDPWWPTKLMVFIWWLWKWRNINYFGNQSDIPSDKILFLLMAHKEKAMILMKDVTRLLNKPNGQQTEIWTGWEPPPVDWIALNTDGALRGNPGMAGGGGVFRDSSGNWLGGFAEKLGLCTSVRAELRALLQGLSLAKERGIWRLAVYVDSQVIVGMLKGNSTGHARYTGIIQRCTKLIETPVGKC